ncbi:tRNA (adenosine(37)-N6)-threonylcarbamoyltransferase complex dimerization subunit type 1 TsaB [Aurantimonas sp. Leaf443]|uniref:tRNA (adenosine(37)-N6)-threonylcarbamoyltransferase complex dimerization subunit type 1 TsaB n=1 Tax=Aurantimonas sp. Leaf443 TaxID=1736378 RepID=UPI0006F1E3EE|nr:tRNA (adenosine(37)-N6)-threonylcarbamoyltransferase complex dimerization subunit type 1 TsaB [Aurantimonas sp. Leaf443]KQT83940.1 hypothetical protein ASG48_11170 [Aurantimonas sp. Leaf443]
MSSLVLAVDTAFDRCSLALLDARSDAILALREPPMAKGHAEALMGLLAEALAEAGVAYGDLGRLGVTVGPGSFTGVRVGVSAVRALALALAIPAVGVTTLEAMAAPYRARGRAVLSVLDAKRGELHVALYASEGACLAPPAAIAPTALEAFVGGALGKGEPLLLVGSGASVACEHLGPGRCEIGLEAARVEIAALARLCAARAPDGPPRPLYLRSADAKPPAPSGLFGAAGPGAAS